MKDLQALSAVLRSAGHVVVLTGAGVSAESGIPTFRGSNGLWENHPVERVASPEGFIDDPALVWRFYSERRANAGAVKPNPGHHALARLERRGISIAPATAQRLGAGVDRAAAKGSRAAVVFVDQNAFVVGVPSRTVITAVDREHMREHVFTNIDSAVIG